MPGAMKNRNSDLQRDTVIGGAKLKPLKKAEWHDMCADRAHAGTTMGDGKTPPVEWVGRVAPLEVRGVCRTRTNRPDKEKQTMKKLMFLGAVAAATVASANVCVTQKVKDECGNVDWVTGAGTAHKVAITLKTTALKSTTKKVQCQDDDCTYYRNQATKKINGLLWEQLDDCTDCVLFGENAAFWTATEAIDAEFAIGVGKIGKGINSKKIEAYGSLVGDDFGALAWAGFGTLTSKTTKQACEDDECAAWVKSISGGIAGTLVAPEYNNVCTDCDPIEYAGCCEDIQLSSTAAYGTIKISYDAATAKKVALAEDADDVTKFAKIPAVIADEIAVNPVAIEE